MSIIKISTKLGLILSLGMVSQFASAQQVVFGGAEYNEDATYGFLGGVYSFNDNLGKGPVIKGWVDWLSYTYSANNIDYTVSGPGLELALGYIQPIAKRSSLAGYVGVCYRDASEKPDDPNNDVDYKECGKAQIEFNSVIGQQTDIQLITSYMTTDAYWNRLRLILPSNGRLRLGADMVFQGDPNYKAYQLASVLHGLKVGTASVSVKVGARKSEGGEALPFVGFEVVK